MTSGGEIEPSSIFPASFQRAAVLNQENWAFSRASENIKPQNLKNVAEVNAENKWVKIYQAKTLVWNFTPFD